MSIEEVIQEALRQVIREELPAIVRQELATHAPTTPPTAPDDNDTLDVEQAAVYAHRQPRTIREWIREGRLRAGGPPYVILRRDLKTAIAWSPRGRREDRVESDDAVRRSETARVLSTLR